MKRIALQTALPLSPELAWCNGLLTLSKPPEAVPQSARLDATTLKRIQANILESICSPRALAGRATRDERRLASLIMPHLAAGLRLRRALRPGDLQLDAQAAEAVFDENARCLNTQGMADAAHAREMLRSAVLDAVRSGTAEGMREPREELLAGRWSLVNRFARQGRRYLVA